VMQLKHERNKSPREMFMMGIMERRVPGVWELIQAQEADVGDAQTYGVDFEAMDDDLIMTDLREREANPFQDHVPGSFSEVRCEAPECPLQPHQVAELNQVLAMEFDMTTRNMEMRQMMWTRGLVHCMEFFA
jgi:hypothetical protein